VLPRKVDVRLPGKGNSNSHGARPVHLIITMIKWIRNSRLSIKNSLSMGAHPRSGSDGDALGESVHEIREDIVINPVHIL